jgi:hypothetical protein
MTGESGSTIRHFLSLQYTHEPVNAVQRNRLLIYNINTFRATDVYKRSSIPFYCKLTKECKELNNVVCIVTCGPISK